MTLRGRDLQEIPADTAAIGQQLLGAADRYRVIGDRLAALVEDAEFAGLYAPHGRNALSPGLLAMVTLFQFLEDLPDRDAARAVVVRLDWKYALHLELGYGGFHYSDLCLFRQRLLAHGEERLVFDLLLAKIQALGFIKKRGKQRTDSIAVLGAVTQLSVLELAWESLRLAVRALGDADPGWSARVLPASFREDYGQRRPDYRLSAAERAALQPMPTCKAGHPWAINPRAWRNCSRKRQTSNRPCGLPIGVRAPCRPRRSLGFNAVPSSSSACCAATGCTIMMPIR